MSNVSTLLAHRKLDYENIQLYEDLFVADADKQTLSLSEAARGYYGRWFRRFGYTLDESDPELFFRTIRDIIRAQRDRDPIEAQIASGRLTGDEAAMWQAALDGRTDDFIALIQACAEKAKATSHERVIPFGHRQG